MIKLAKDLVLGETILMHDSVYPTYEILVNKIESVFGDTAISINNDILFTSEQEVEVAPRFNDDYFQDWLEQFK